MAMLIDWLVLATYCNDQYMFKFVKIVILALASFSEMLSSWLL